MAAERPKRRKRSPKQCAAELAIEKRREQATKLRLEGWSIREIGKRLRCSPTTVHEDIAAVLERTRDAAGDAIEKQKRLSLARIDRAVRAIWGKVEAGELEAVRELIRIEARRAKIEGFDAADKLEMSGPAGGAIPVDMSVRGSLAVKLQELRKRLGGGAEPDGAGREPGGDAGAQPGASG
jgi:transposase